MQELDVTWNRVLSVWWLIVWRAALGGAIIGAVVGFIVGFTEDEAGVTPQTITLSSGIVGAVVNLIWSLFIVRMALRKKYGEFRLAMVPHAPIMQ